MIGSAAHWPIGQPLACAGLCKHVRTQVADRLGTGASPFRWQSDGLGGGLLYSTGNSQIPPSPYSRVAPDLRDGLRGWSTRRPRHLHGIRPTSNANENSAVTEELLAPCSSDIARVKNFNGPEFRPKQKRGALRHQATARLTAESGRVFVRLVSGT
jgi:hypothetical protein